MQNETHYEHTIARIAEHYFGAPNIGLSTPGKELRFGNHGSKSVDLVKGTYYDHEENVGGGAVDLIRKFEPGANIADKLEEFGLPKTEMKRRVETAFDYVDENGQLRYQVVRIDTTENGRTSKDYRQRSFDAETNTTTWGMSGVTALPYRLPDILAAAPTMPIIIVEGEKCADALARLGLVATTNHGGAGNWWPTLTPWFKGRQIIIIPDNDQAGEKHLIKVANALRDVASKVAVLRLPDLGPKGDVADWLASGKTRADMVAQIRTVQPVKWDEFDAAVKNKPISDVIASKPTGVIDATLFTWLNPSDIPIRRFIYGTHYIRKFVSLDVAPGGVGKSSLVIVEALAITSGKPLLGFTANERGRVWYFNGEDPMDEIQRRVVAAIKHYDITPDEIEGRLFLDSGRSQPIIIGVQQKDGAVIQEPIVDAVIDTIKRNRIDVLILDPFVSTHQVMENDNNAVDRVAKTWAKIADITGCSINLVHHSRKTGGIEVGIEDGRGASSLASAARSARAFNQMTDDEAAKAGVENRRLFFRTDNGKANLAPPSDKATWHKLVGVPLNNGASGLDGDVVGVVTAWNWPDHMDGVSVGDLRVAQLAISQTGPWRADVRSSEWVGIGIAKALRIDLNDRNGKAKVGGLVRQWTASGMFKVVDGQDENRHKRQFVEVGDWAN